MTAGERLFVRVDATLDTGLGHFNRCLAIAQCWREAVGPATFIGRYAGALHEDLADEHVDVVAIKTACPDSADIEETTKSIPAGSSVVLDGYHFDPGYQQRLAEDRRLLVIDDTGHHAAYAGSILLNANVYADTIEYTRAPPHRLLGLRYALLRREFRRLRTASAPETGRVENLLVCLGGADAANDTLTVLHALEAATIPPTHVRVVVGPLNPHVETLERFAESHASIEIRRDPKAMSAELLAADFVVAGAGTISAELAFLGKPALLLAVADNQLATGPRMQQAGGAIYAGDVREIGFERLVTTLTEALSNTEKHESIRVAGPSLVDGQGAVRICSILNGATHD